MPRSSGRGSGEFGDSLPYFEEADGQRRRRAKKKKRGDAHKGGGRTRRSRGGSDWDDDYLEHADRRLMEFADEEELAYGDDLDEDADWYGADDFEDDDEEADWHSHDDR